MAHLDLLNLEVEHVGNTRRDQPTNIAVAGKLGAPELGDIQDLFCWFNRG